MGIFCIELNRQTGVFSPTMSSPRWIVNCHECEKEFTHTQISKIDSGMRNPFASPPKPEIPEEGTKLTCPHCGKDLAYRAFDLRYRAD